MDGVTPRGGWVKNAVGGLVLLVALAYVAKVVYGWLMPLVPNLLGLLMVIGVVVGVAHARRRR